MTLDSLKQKITRREPVVGAAVGSGMAAAAAEEGGADLILALNVSHFRFHGNPSTAAYLPFANANEMTWDIATRHVMTHLRRTPVALGICAQDPDLDLDDYLRKIRDFGFAGVTNFPTVSFYDATYREALEENGLGIDREVELITKARELGLFTIGWSYSPEDAVALAKAGADVLCLNLGLAEWRDVDATDHQAALDRATLTIRNSIQEVKKAVPRPYCVIFGGPVILPQDTAQMYERTEALGYIGGSSVERFPTAPAITQTMRDFKHAAAAGRKMNRLGALIGTGPAMHRVFDTIRAVADSNAAVLIIGESGTGKELAAREIHRLSPVHPKPMVSWNCGATSESLAMSELFGHERGAFTGATRTHVGQFETASGSTLFMDEVTDLPLSVQASLLRVIQEREIVRVGGEKTIAVNVRLIAASNKDFQELIPAGLFRLDLYYRLSTVVLRMPPLRERQEDIPFLVWDLAQEFSQKYGRPVPRIPDSVMNALIRHPWPGNIRELRNVVERLFLLGRDQTLSRVWFEQMFAADRTIGGKIPMPSPVDASFEARKERLDDVLSRHKGNKSAAARELGVTRKTVHKWLKTRNR